MNVLSSCLTFNLLAALGQPSEKKTRKVLETLMPFLEEGVCTLELWKHTEAAFASHANCKSPHVLH